MQSEFTSDQIITQNVSNTDKSEQKMTSFALPAKPTVSVTPSVARPVHTLLSSLLANQAMN